jgi:hypothetical protein
MAVDAVFSAQRARTRFSGAQDNDRTMTSADRRRLPDRTRVIVCYLSFGSSRNA